MADNHTVEYTENTFFQSFQHQSFASRIALWVKAFSYSFIALQVFSMLLEQLQNYCITPPDLFFQFLFVLLMSGIIEFICIQMTNVSDHTMLDYAKNLVTYVQHRFVMRKVSVLASFEQVRVIGVTARAQTIFDSFFSDPKKRYALVIMNYRNLLIHITDYNLDIEEANGFAIELTNRHMPSARLLTGEPDTELVADALSGDITARPVKTSVMALVDAAILPALHAFCALMITAALVSISMLAISRISTGIFDTDVLVTYQPVTQLFLKPVPRPDAQPEPETPKPKTAVVNNATSAPASFTESFPAVSNAFPAPTDEAVIAQETSLSSDPVTITETVLYQASETPAIPETKTITEYEVAAPASVSSLATVDETATSTIPAPVATAGGTENTAVSAPEQQPESQEQPTTPPEDAAKTETETEKTATPDIVNSEKIPVPSIAAMQPTATQPATTPEPDLKEKVLSNSLPANHVDHIIVRPESPPLQAQIPTVDLKNISGNIPVPASQMALDILPVPSIAAMQLPATQPATPPAKPAKAASPEHSILAGYGLHPLVVLGDKASSAVKKIGTPLARQNTSSGKQLIFNGFSVSADGHSDAIKQITITKATLNSNAICQTPQKIGVGSQLSQVKARFGPSSIIDSIPGLHFPALGISFIPSPIAPETVGAIKIYPAGTRPE